MPDNLLHDAPYGIDRDGKANACVRSGWAIDGSVHADYLPFGVEERATTVPGVDSGICLHAVLYWPPADAHDLPAQRRDHPCSQGAVQSEGVADGDDALAYPEVGATPNSQWLQASNLLGVAVELEDGDILVFLVADETGVKHKRGCIEAHPCLLSVLDDVEIGNHMTFRVPHEARTAATWNLHRFHGEWRLLSEHGGADEAHTRSAPLEDVANIRFRFCEGRGLTGCGR
mmetsp:Transcript_9261/g.26950  ORF Transcript_9261/g.26950 Transcript_9261/m.26950 type:complete len:230 (-) Transcript_9261:242-931(-)